MNKLMVILNLLTFFWLGCAIGSSKVRSPLSFEYNAPILPPISACADTFEYIYTHLPQGRTMVELGSGQGSEYFSKYYTVYSIEHSSQWINKYKTNYIYAPIKKDWYDTEVIKKSLPKDYDLIFVDGPPARKHPRSGFLKNIHLFKQDVPIVFDDVNRPADLQHMIAVAIKLKRKFEIYTCTINKGKKFGVVTVEPTSYTAANSGTKTIRG